MLSNLYGVSHSGISSPPGCTTFGPCRRQVSSIIPCKAPYIPLCDPLYNISEVVLIAYQNPHSENLPARSSGVVVDEVREKTLRFLGADPKHFDLIFVANSTAAIKLVADSFRDLAEKSRSKRFWYGYHKDAHTSLVGVREYSYGQHHCFESDAEVAAWIDAPTSNFVNNPDPRALGLFAYPGQSNMSGRRLPLSWLSRIRCSATLQNTCEDPPHSPQVSNTFPDMVFRYFI